MSAPGQDAAAPRETLVEIVALAAINLHRRHTGNNPWPSFAAARAGYRDDMQKRWLAHEIARAEAIVDGPIAALQARLAAAESRAAEAERDHPTNDTLQRLGAFGRKTGIGKHQAIHWGYLRTLIDALDAAGRTDAADVLVWLVWHMVNDRARHDEHYRFVLSERDTAQADVAALAGEVERLRAALDGAVCCFHNDGRRAGFHAGFMGFPRHNTPKDAYAAGKAARTALSRTTASPGGEGA